MSSDDRADRLRSRRNESKKKAQQQDAEDTEQNETNSSTSDRVRDREAVTMYLPDDLHEELRLTWLEYAADHPDAQKNKDYFTAVVREGLKNLDV